MILFEDARRAAFGRSSLNGDSFTVLYNACKAVESLPGMVVEIGVGKGGSAKFLMRCLPGKEFDLFDPWAECDTAYLREDNPAKFTTQGVFPDVLDCDFADKPTALVHVDVNDAETIAAAIDFYWSELAVGGIIMIQAYPCVAEIVSQLRANPGNFTLEEIGIPGALGYVKITRTAADDSIFDLDTDDDEEEEDDDKEPITATVTNLDGSECERGEDGLIHGEELEGETEPISDMRKVEVQRDGAWVSVESLLDVKENEIFHLMEPDGDSFGESLIATGDGYLNEENIPSIMCDVALLPREEGDTTPLTEGETPDGLTAEDITPDELTGLEGEVSEEVAADDAAAATSEEPKKVTRRKKTDES